MAVDPAGALALISGVPLTVLGILLLGLRPSRAPALFFASFATLWGLQVILANLGRTLVDFEIHAITHPLSLALWPAAALFLAYFAMRTRDRAARISMVLVYASAGVIAMLLLLLDPSKVVSYIVNANGPTTQFGPAYPWLFLLPFYTSFYVGIIAFYGTYRKAPPGTERYRARSIIFALALFTSYNSIRQTFVWLDPPAGVAVLGTLAQTVMLSVFIAGTALIVGIFVHLVVRPPRLEATDPALLAAFAMPAFVALLESILVRQGVTVDTIGIWRLFMVAALVRALARDELFDLDLRLQRLAGPGLGALAFGFGAVLSLLFLIGGASPVLTWSPFTAGTLIGGLVHLRSDKIGKRLFPGVLADDDYLHQRAVEVYRMRLAHHLAAGGAPDTDELLLLRRRLGLDSNDHAQALRTMGDRLPTSSATTPAIGTGAMLHARYRIERLLGQGSHGRAFLAFDTNAQRNVVIKIVATSHLGGRAAAALRREAEILARIDHPHVIDLYDIADEGNEVHMVLEHADGGNLQGLLDRRGRIPLDEAIDLSTQILDGLHAAHQASIIHRDIKPENILLTRSGHAKIADFGVARATGPDATGITQGNVGTLLYMSPEQVRGTHVDVRTDLYAVGVLLHILITGQYYLPLAGKDDFQVRKMILEEQPENRPEVPAPLRTVIARLLAKDPQERPADAAQARLLLERARS